VNVLTEAIERGLPLVVVSPHLDDAALSCGGLMAHAASRTSVTVVTLFTEANRGPHTLSARRYLHQVGAHSAETLYQQRRAEDRAALEPKGITCVHAGLTEALFRRRPVKARRRLWAHLMPELAHIYPVYRLHLTSGRIATADADTLRDAEGFVQRLVGSGRHLLMAPLGVGGHVDHVLARSVAERSGARVVYYSDFPYNQQNPVPDGFIQRNGLMKMQGFEFSTARAELIRAYRTQVQAMFPGGRIPLAHEVFFVPGDREHAPLERLDISGRLGANDKYRIEDDDADGRVCRAGSALRRLCCLGRWHRDPDRATGDA
jgi:LmbE family N-acetylglucosaminyl deacetylase